MRERLEFNFPFSEANLQNEEKLTMNNTEASIFSEKTTWR